MSENIKLQADIWGGLCNYEMNNKSSRTASSRYTFFFY
jgi:hypothetical protein